MHCDFLTRFIRLTDMLMTNAMHSLTKESVESLEIALTAVDLSGQRASEANAEAAAAAAAAGTAPSGTAELSPAAAGAVSRVQSTAQNPEREPVASIVVDGMLVRLFPSRVLRRQMARSAGASAASEMDKKPLPLFKVRRKGSSVCEIAIYFFQNSLSLSLTHSLTLSNILPLFLPLFPFSFPFLLFLPPFFSTDSARYERRVAVLHTQPVEL